MTRAHSPIPAYDAFKPYRSFISDFPRFLEAIKGPCPRHVRIGSLKADPISTRDGLFSRGLIAGESLFLASFFRVVGDLSPGPWPEYSLGLVHSQSLASGIASAALGAEPGERVLDLCAAPGSKTTHLAELMENTGLIVANDKNQKRLVALRHNLKRLGVLNAATTCYRGENYPKGVLFHRVLVDAPCSGEGSYRSDRCGLLKSRPPKRARLNALQKRLILRGFDLLAPGGVMVYSTCTYNPRENEDAVDHLLKSRDAELLPLTIDGPFEPGLEGYEEKRYSRGIERCARLYPHRLESEGFFLARIRRRG